MEDIGFLYNAKMPRGPGSLLELSLAAVAANAPVHFEAGVLGTLPASLRVRVLRHLARQGQRDVIYVQLSDVERLFDLVMRPEVRLPLIQCVEWLLDAGMPVGEPILQVKREKKNK
jgi:hypothetical protein